MSDKENPIAPATTLDSAPHPQVNEGVPKTPAGVTSAQWKYVPIPTDAPDLHDEYDSRAEATPAGWKIVGARVRGKKHKHEGTHCDDWFEFAVSSPWIVVAVSDGAGSKRFSRVGARASCQTAVNTLKERLRSLRLSPRRWTEDNVFALDDKGDFLQDDLKEIAAALQSAMQSAQQAVQQEASERSNSLKHYKALGNREIDVNDLQATLMLMVQTGVRDTDGNPYDLIMGCSVGDGMMAAIDKAGKPRLLLAPDSGQFAGETEFLTEEIMVEPAKLKGRLRIVFGSPQRALLAMTDGVADDYFPNDPGMSRLYGDLVLNGIIAIRGPTQEEMALALRETQLPTPEEVQKAEFTVQGERLTAAGLLPVKLNSVARYAEQLAIPLEQVLASPALLLAGWQGSPVLSQTTSPAERLHIWLDSYQVRGSFDDRTLVAVYREEP
jgi:hypothetical protein